MLRNRAEGKKLLSFRDKSALLICLKVEPWNVNHSFWNPSITDHLLIQWCVGHPVEKQARPVQIITRRDSRLSFDARIATNEKAIWRMHFAVSMDGGEHWPSVIMMEVEGTNQPVWCELAIVMPPRKRQHKAAKLLGSTICRFTSKTSSSPRRSCKDDVTEI